MANPLNVTTGEHHAGTVAVQKNFESDAAAAGVMNVTAAVDLGGGALGVVSQQQAMGLQVAGAPATNTVVVYQPQIQVQGIPVQTVKPYYQYAFWAFLFAVMTTIICFSLAMLSAVPFSIVGWVLAHMAESAHKKEKYEKAKKLKICSISWTFVAIASGILAPIIIALSIIYGIPNNNNNNYYY